MLPAFRGVIAAPLPEMAGAGSLDAHRRRIAATSLFYELLSAFLRAGERRCCRVFAIQKCRILLDNRVAFMSKDALN